MTLWGSQSPFGCVVDCDRRSLPPRMILLGSLNRLSAVWSIVTVEGMVGMARRRAQVSQSPFGCVVDCDWRPATEEEVEAKRVSIAFRLCGRL